ncbi:MAG TPA: tetratricopeptide repeat protein, partial [Acidobacteriota bacterium]|nr:tetratricopeptide repeat protein [Acidobacteriota bacterium]
DEMSCSHCKTLIMRRYCSGCSQLIPDHATICPLCGKNVKEHFLYAKLRRAKFFISICMFAIFILLLFLLVWQQSFSETTPLQADTKRNEPKPPPITSGNPDVNEEEVNLAEPEHAPQEITLPKPEQLQENRKPHVRKPIAQLPTETSTEPEQKVEEPVVAQAPAVEETPPNPAMSASTQRALVLNAQQRIKRGRFLNNRGFSLIKEGRPSEAIPLLEQSVRSFPQGTGDVTYAYALFNLAVAYRMSGRPDIAIPILEERIKINNQRDAVQRELIAAKRQARESGQTTSDQEIR